MSDDWPVYSQHPFIAKGPDKAYAESHYLPELKKAWAHIERTTGYRWKCTSYWRNSPSHRLGVSLDIAPDISAKSDHLYAVSKNSDPVLYKRTALIRKLQHAARTYTGGTYMVGVFIEPDHLHLQVLQAEPKKGFMRIVKWKVAKPIYPDTYQRMALPIMK